MKKKSILAIGLTAALFSALPEKQRHLAGETSQAKQRIKPLEVFSALLPKRNR